LNLYGGHTPEELLLSEKSVTYFFEESVRCVPNVDALAAQDGLQA
jgi:hypothetical protein